MQHSQPNPDFKAVFDARSLAPVGDVWWNTFKYEPKSASKLTQRVDSKGVLRWFHATKGWRGPVHA